jgi:hypothetical protein
MCLEAKIVPNENEELNENVNLIDTNNTKKEYILTPKLGLSLQSGNIKPLSALEMEEILINKGVEVIHRITRSEKVLKTLGGNEGQASDIFLVKMNPEEAEYFKRTTPELLITESTPIGYENTSTLKPLRAFPTTANIITRKYQFKVESEEGSIPVKNVSIKVIGDGLIPGQDITDEHGIVNIEVKLEESGFPKGLIVSPPHSYGDLILNDPNIEERKVNTIKLSSIFKNEGGDAGTFHYNWGQIFMGLNNMPNDINGKGVKIAIIDSGCDNSHPLLKHIQIGADFTKNPGNPDGQTWVNDEIGHGTHCAGTIAAKNNDFSLFRGFAPEAEIHILKIFPSNLGSLPLVKALEYCLDKDIDLINMSLGMKSGIAPEIEEVISLAVSEGITCIVSAGNSHDTDKKVFYPASSPNVLAISAIGDLQHLDKNTWAATTLQENYVSDNLFFPSFSCFGPEIDYCAPGVSIISTAPGATFKSDSGTSMATPHVTGLAALLTAHHPLLQSKTRNKERVATLTGLLSMQSRKMKLDNERMGAGIPLLGEVVDESN